MPPPCSRHQLMQTTVIVVVAFVLYGLVFTIPTLKEVADGVESVQKILSERLPPREPVRWERKNDHFEYEIEPMWSCSDTDRKKKLVFAHIFKTAGSSIRELLSKYAESCKAGYVTVINCGAVSKQSLEKGNNWVKDREHSTYPLGTECFLKRVVYRNKTIVEARKDPINSTFLEEANVDILSGHVSLGIDEKWNNEEGKHVDVQYVTFFRSGARKFVSGLLYLRPHLSFDEAVEQVKESVRQSVAKSEYLSDIKSIMTPSQRDDLKKRNATLTMEESVSLMIQNLKDNNVLVGIVERMSESLEMLQHLVDSDGKLGALFESYGMRAPETNTTIGRRANKSKLSSEAVLAEVEKDVEFMKVMREFVKFDDEVYQFAYEMHMRQYEAFKRRKPSTIVKSNDVRVPKSSLEVMQVEKAQVDAAPEGSDEHTSFTEVAPMLDDYQNLAEPMWSCKDKSREQKLVFVHIFKTAGSTMRRLLNTYAETCNAGLNLVIRCAPVQPSTVRTENWIREDKVPCELIQTVYRNNTIVRKPTPMNTSHLEASNADILGGHITMGTEHAWKDDKGEHVDVQYLIFFRESAHKFVSAVLFMNPKLSFEQAVAHIKEKVPRHVKSGKFLDNTGYLLTPVQRDQFRNVTLSMEDKLGLAMKNLKENRVLVGIVERMSESLELI